MAKFETKLLPAEEAAFQAWKRQMAPKDSGEDYDLRGAFKVGAVPDPATGHWPDTFKKPNHPSFSNQSMYHPENPINSALNSAAGNPDLNATIRAADPASAIGSTRLFPSLEAQQRILGTKTTSRQTPAQKADQAAFDSRFTAGQFTPSATGRLPWGGDAVPATRPGTGPATARAPILPKPTVDSVYKPTTGYDQLPPNVYTAPATVAPPAPAPPAATAGVNPTPIPGMTPTPTPTPVPTATPTATPTIVPTPGTGRTAEAGVSRSQAAGIQQPTKQNPVPITPTSPVLDVDDFDKRKPKFAGF